MSSGHGIAPHGQLAVDGEVDDLESDVGKGALDVLEDGRQLVTSDLEALVATGAAASTNASVRWLVCSVPVRPQATPTCSS